MNLMDFGGSSDEEETKGFSGSGMAQVARVSFDPHSSSVVGWDSIWRIIEAEDSHKDALKDKLNDGIGAYVEKQRISVNGPIPTPEKITPD